MRNALILSLILFFSSMASAGYYQWKSTDLGASCHNCTYEQMEDGIEEIFPFRIIDRDNDGIPDGRQPNLRREFDFFVFDKSRSNFVRYHIIYKPYQNYLNYSRKPSLIATKDNFNGEKADYYSYKDFIQLEWEKFQATLPTAKISKRGEDDCPNADTLPNNTMDSLFDAISGAYESSVLSQLTYDLNQSEQQWHKSDCVMCRISGAQLQSFGISLHPDHDNQIIYNFPDGQAVWTVRNHMNHTRPRFTLNVTDSVFTVPQSIWVPDQGETSNQNFNLGDFFYWNDATQEFIVRNNAPMILSPCFNRHLEQALERMGVTFEGSSSGNFRGLFLDSEQCRSWPEERTHSTTFWMPWGTRPCSNGRPGCVSPTFIPVQFFVSRTYMREVCGGF